MWALCLGRSRAASPPWWSMSTPATPLGGLTPPGGQGLEVPPVQAPNGARREAASWSRVSAGGCRTLPGRIRRASSRSGTGRAQHSRAGLGLQDRIPCDCGGPLDGLLFGTPLNAYPASHGFDAPAGPSVYLGGGWRWRGPGVVCRAELASDPGRWDRGAGARQNSPGSRAGDPRGGVAGAVSPREGLQEGRSGAIAQLGERVHGMHEVRGSSPLGSTKLANEGGTAEVSLRPLAGGGSPL